MLQKLLFFFDKFGKPPVEDENFAKFSDNDIFGFKIAVKDIFGVGIGYSLANRNENTGKCRNSTARMVDFFSLKSLMVKFSKICLRVSPLTLRHRVVDFFLFLMDCIDRNDRLVSELAGDMRFFKKAAVDLFVVEKVFSDTFEGYFSSANCIVSEIDLAHPPFQLYQ